MNFFQSEPSINEEKQHKRKIKSAKRRLVNKEIPNFDIEDMMQMVYNFYNFSDYYKLVNVSNDIHIIINILLSVDWYQHINFSPNIVQKSKKYKLL